MLRKLLPDGMTSLRKAVSNPRAAIDQALADSPIPQARDFWDGLIELEEWWPLLIPVLLWVLWRTYQRERTTLGVLRDQS